MEYSGAKKALTKVGDHILEFVEAVENYESVEDRYPKKQEFKDVLEEVKAKNKAFCSAKKLVETMRKACEELEEKLEALEVLEVTRMFSREAPHSQEPEKLLYQDFEVPLPGDRGVVVDKMTVKEIIEGLGIEGLGIEVPATLQ